MTHRRFPRSVTLLLGVLLLGTSPPSARADPPSVPKKIEGRPSQIVRIEISTEAEIGWQPAFEESDNVFFDELAPRGHRRRFFLQAMQPGTFPVVFWTKGETTGAVCVVSIQGSVPPGPTPPNPKPPNPTPPEPKPPGPTPPPVPTDPLVLALKKAYAADKAADKATSLKHLAELYRQSASLARKPEITTWGQLFQVMLEAANSLGVRGKLLDVQNVIQAQLTLTLPTKFGSAFDIAARDLARTTFLRIAAALEEAGR